MSASVRLLSPRVIDPLDYWRRRHPFAAPTPIDRRGQAKGGGNVGQCFLTAAPVLVGGHTGNGLRLAGQDAGHVVTEKRCPKTSPTSFRVACTPLDALSDWEIVVGSLLDYLYYRD